MKIYIADTNFYLRFLLQDNKKQYLQSKKYLQQAKDGKIKIIFVSSVILEMSFILNKYFSLNREDVAKYLTSLLKTSYIDIEDRKIWIDVFLLYKKSGIDLIDIYLFLKARKEKAEILSFDKDFVKLKRKIEDKKG